MSESPVQDFEQELHRVTVLRNQAVDKGLSYKAEQFDAQISRITRVLVMIAKRKRARRLNHDRIVAHYNTWIEAATDNYERVRSALERPEEDEASVVTTEAAVEG